MMDPLLVIPQSFQLELVEYLADQKYKEVAGFIQRLSLLQPAPEPEPPTDVAEPSSNGSEPAEATV